jgi:hypothetical protein
VGPAPPYANAPSLSYLGHVEEKLGALVLPTALALRPGPAAQLSSFEPVSEATVGVSVSFPITLRDSYNAIVPSSFSITPSLLSRFSITAEGSALTAGGEEFAVTIPGVVSIGPASTDGGATLVAELELKSSGDWAVFVAENGVNLDGAPFDLHVLPAATDPSTCTAQHDNEFTAGADFVIDVSTNDAFKNPTSHSADSFSFTSSSATTAIASDESGTFTFSTQTGTAGSFSVSATHSPTGLPAAGSPYYFTVLPGAVSPPHCSHSLENPKLLSVESIADSTVVLSVNAADEFNNTIVDSVGFSVSIDGETHPLEPPRYEHPLPLAAGTDAVHEIEFMYGSDRMVSSRPIPL